MRRRRTLLLPSMLAFGFAFLYVPILSMIVYSFNASRLVTVWDAMHSPTLKWYRALFANAQIIDAAWLSLKIAAMNATVTTSAKCPTSVCMHFPVLTSHTRTV